MRRPICGRFAWIEPGSLSASGFVSWSTLSRRPEVRVRDSGSRLRPKRVPASRIVWGGGMWLVFTDLDGTLLDADTYSYEAASPALERLRERGTPLVMVTSKTRAEVELWRWRLSNRDP